jgi:predicted Zn finger-like uncharacterized protein
MKLTCPACSAKYNVSDERLDGRRVKVRCKRCGEMPGEEARYCAKCGEAVGAEFPAKDEPEEDDAPESSKPGARLAGVLVARNFETLLLAPADLPRFTDIAGASASVSAEQQTSLMKKVVICKLNGGLGTGMGSA